MGQNPYPSALAARILGHGPAGREFQAEGPVRGSEAVVGIAPRHKRHAGAGAKSQENEKGQKNTHCFVSSGEWQCARVRVFVKSWRKV